MLARRALAVVIAGAVALSIAWLSRAPASPEETSGPLLRLSWRVLGARVEECRTRTEEELAALAAHMRTPQVCTGYGADYELTVRIDGTEALRDTVRPAGARRDRPVYVFQDLLLEPGRHDVRVEFSALIPPSDDDDDDGDDDDGPRTYEWEGAVVVGPAEIALVTIDPEGDLVLRER